VSQLVFELSVTLGLAGALLAGVTALVQGHGFWTLALRSLISGGIFFLFAFLGGQIVARSLLERIARRRLEREAAPKPKEPQTPSPADYLEEIRQAAVRAEHVRQSDVHTESAAPRASHPNREAA
jgi:hypothetical protein